MLSGDALFRDPPHVLAQLDRDGAPAGRTHPAEHLELHTMSVDGQVVMRMREVDGIALAPKAIVKMRPGLGMHLMLVGLKQPLREGETFAMTLEFERAGKVEVKVIVGQPKPGAAASSAHMH